MGSEPIVDSVRNVSFMTCINCKHDKMDIELNNQFEFRLKCSKCHGDYGKFEIDDYPFGRPMSDFNWKIVGGNVYTILKSSMMRQS